jgi:hypothetical protein
LLVDAGASPAGTVFVLPLVVVELSDGAQPAIKPTKPNNAIKVYSRFIVQVSFA